MGERRILRLEFLLTANFFRYFMFAASLVVLMNQFSSLYQTNDYAETMSDAIKIVEYCAVEDPQARRVLDIIQRFSQVVTTWTKDHAYPAPPLSSDFSCLSVPAVRTNGYNVAAWLRCWGFVEAQLRSPADRRADSWPTADNAGGCESGDTRPLGLFSAHRCDARSRSNQRRNKPPASSHSHGRFCREPSQHFGAFIHVERRSSPQW
jgi:hypothetical protein